jgi:hypothetical protein
MNKNIPKIVNKLTRLVKNPPKNGDVHDANRQQEVHTNPSRADLSDKLAAQPATLIKEM